MDYYQLFDMERDLSMLMSREKIGEMIDEELLQCADMCARVDEIMDTVHQYSKKC